jgi:type IV pilus assembly protein PilQ
MKTPDTLVCAVLCCLLSQALLMSGEPPDQGVPEPSAVQKKMGTIVSVDFRETPIEDVLRSLAEQAEVDLVKSPKVTGDVTATLTDVPLAEALDNILAIHGYGYLTTENIIRIVPQAELAAQTKLDSRIYRISYANIVDVEKALKNVLTKQGKIAANPSTSNILVTDAEPQLQLIDQIVKEIDREVPQILVEARIYDISSSDGLDIGFEWFASRRTIFDPATGEPIGGKTDPFLASLFDAGISRAPKTDSLLRFGLLNDNADLDVQFTAAAENVKAKLLANPKILVVDNEKANIKIISEIPYQELTQTSGGGNIGSTRFKEVGVQLDVTPHVTRDGMIKLQVQPSFSVQTDTVSIIIPVENQTISSPQPVVDKREAITTALIEDDQTVVIGGLRKKDVIDETSKVPILGDIPILGSLFTFTGQRTENSELVVFITPRIVRKAALSDEESRQFEYMEEELSTTHFTPPAENDEKE